MKVADNDVAELDFAYDDLGRLDTATQTYVGGLAYTAQFDYVVAAGDVRRIITYPNGRVVTETYDGRLRLDDFDGGPGVGADYSYDLADRRTGTALGNGVSSVFGFDLADRLTSIQHARDVTALFNVDYGYDAVGNRLFTRNLTPGLEERSELYEYDQRHRLRRMDRGEVSGDPDPVLITPIADNDLAAAQDWTILDRRGNWNEFAETIGVSPVTTTQTRSPNGVNEYQAIDPDGPGPQSPVNLAHDANGNVTLDPTARNLGDGEGSVPDPSGQIYEYDEENRLTAVRRAYDNALLLSISYDAVGRRVSSADYLAAGDPCGGPPALTRHIFAALETLEEHLSCDGGTNYALAREFVWGDRFPQPVALITHGGTGGFGGPAVPAGESVYHYLHDVLGSVVALTNAGGQVVERYTYDPYGKTVIEETNPATGLPTARLEASAFGNPFAWTGQRYDAGVRLYHFLFRGYSPSLGRWLQRDPAEYVDGLSLYHYAQADPLYWIDRFGLEVRVGGTPKQRKAIEDMLRKLCDRARVDPKTGKVTLEPEPKPEDDKDKKCPDTQPATQPGDPPPNNAGCPMLEKLINSDKKTVINFGSKPFMRKAGSPGGFEITSDKQSNVWIIVDGKVRYFDENGNIVESGTWHVLWDELTHAVRWVDGRRSNDPAKEEAEQIEETNKLITTEGLPPRKGHDTPPKNKKP